MANRTYEVMYIIDPETSEENIGKLNESVGKLVETEGGTVIRVDEMGRRKLAYPINKKKEGFYVLYEIEGSGQEIAELERRMRVNDAVLRYITVRVDEDRKCADKKKLKRDTRANKRASFRQSGETNENEMGSDAQ